MNRIHNRVSYPTPEGQALIHLRARRKVHQVRCSGATITCHLQKSARIALTVLTLSRKFSLRLLKKVSTHEPSRFTPGRYTSYVLLASLLTCSVPAPVTATGLQDAITCSSAWRFERKVRL